ncbi:MAG: hypothetical protein Q4A71_06550 [Actinomycetaceae bacterium]|nr:hypothetical protein [Actinomycetaceae bacterium]
MRRLLRYLGAVDPVRNLVVFCDHTVVGASVAAKDFGIIWGDCAGPDAREIAQILVQGARHVVINTCAPASLKEIRFATDLVKYGTAPPPRWRKGPIFQKDKMPFPRRALLPTPMNSPIDHRESAPTRTFRAIHALSAQGKVTVPVPGGNSKDDGMVRAHALHCQTCEEQLRLCAHTRGWACETNNNDGERQPADVGDSVAMGLWAYQNWWEVCPYCRAALSVCPSQHVAEDAARLALLKDLPATTTPINADDTSWHCRKCGVGMLTADQLCDLCSYREHNPFTAVLPAGVLEKLEPEVRAKLSSI